MPLNIFTTVHCLNIWEQAPPSSTQLHAALPACSCNVQSSDQSIVCNILHRRTAIFGQLHVKSSRLDENLMQWAASASNPVIVKICHCWKCLVTPIIAIVLAKHGESNPPSVIAPALSGALYRPTKQFYTGLLHKHNPSGPEMLASPRCADCKQYPAAELLFSITLVHKQWAN